MGLAADVGAGQVAVVVVRVGVPKTLVAQHIGGRRRCIAAAADGQVDQAGHQIKASLAHTLHRAAAGVDAACLQAKACLERAVDVHAIYRQRNAAQRRDLVRLGSRVNGAVGNGLADARGGAIGRSVGPKTWTRVADNGAREFAGGWVE